MGQAITSITIIVLTVIFALGFIYLVRKETEKMESRNYKKFKGEKLLREQLR